MKLFKRVHLSSFCNCGVVLPRFALRRIFSKNHRGIVSDFLPWLLIAIAILVILMITVFVLQGSGFSLIDKIKGIASGG